MSSVSARSNNRKRKAPSSEAASDYEDHSDHSAEYQASKPSRKRSNVVAQPSDKSDKKAARMERNRQAAQASRDRKKVYTQELEAKIQELERLLEQSSCCPVQPTPTDNSRVEELEAENAALKAQLATSQSETSLVKQRLDGLEAKLELLTNVLTNNNAKRNSVSMSSSSVSPCISPLQLSASLSTQQQPIGPLFDPTTLVDLLPAPPTATPMPANGVLERQALVNQVEPLVASERSSLPRTSTLIQQTCLSPVQHSQIHSSTQTKQHQHSLRKNYQIWQKNLLGQQQHPQRNQSIQTTSSIPRSLLLQLIKASTLQQQQTRTSSSTLTRSQALLLKKRMAQSRCKWKRG